MASTSDDPGFVPGGIQGTGIGQRPFITDPTKVLKGLGIDAKPGDVIKIEGDDYLVGEGGEPLPMQ